MNSKINERVVFNLSIEDKELLTNQCDFLQVSISFYVRNCVMEKLGKPIIEVKRQNIDVKNYSAQLLKIGNNLNQVSRKLNSGAKFMIADQKSVLNQIEALNNHILDIQSKL